MGDRHRRFVWVLAGCFCSTLLPVFILNMAVLNATLGNNQMALLASQWQQRTHGSTYAPTLDGHHLFKTLRLNDRAADINTVVFGSSIMMGITQQAFPRQFSLYSFTKNSNPLGSVIAEAEYVQQHFANVRWYVVPLDWSLGFLYQTMRIRAVDLSLATAMEKAADRSGGRAPLLERMREAISYPRIAALAGTVKSILLAGNKRAAFREKIIQVGSDEYTCPDGSVGKDFDSMFRGLCAGFSYDGSSTFSYLNRVGGNAPSLILAALEPGSRYTTELTSAKGEPNPRFLERLATLAKAATRAGGGLILVMPPLLPGMEAAFLRNPQLGSALDRTKQALADWSRREQLTILDAGQSERFGCLPEEFVDQHHAVDSCYKKVFQFLWRQEPWPVGLLAPPASGLHQGQGSPQ